MTLTFIKWLYFKCLIARFFSSSYTRLSSSFKSSRKCSLKLFSNLKTGLNRVFSVTFHSKIIIALHVNWKFTWRLSGVDSILYKWKQTYYSFCITTPIILVPVYHSIRFIQAEIIVFRSLWDYGWSHVSWGVHGGYEPNSTMHVWVGKSCFGKRVQVWLATKEWLDLVVWVSFHFINHGYTVYRSTALLRQTSKDFDFMEQL